MIKNIFPNYKNLLFNKGYSLRHKITNSIIIATIATYLSSTIINIIIGLYSTAVLTIICSGISLYALKISVVDKKYKFSAIIMIVIIVFVTFPYIFLNDAGIHGSIPYYIVVFSSVFPVLYTGVKKKIAIALYFFVLAILVMINIFFPEMIMDYTSEMARKYDLAFTIFVTSILTIFIVNVIHNEYSAEQEKTKQLNNLLVEEKSKYEELSKLDSLTELYNHNYIIAYLKEQSEICTKKGLIISIVFIDIDNFKVINDKYGHLFGDGVLRSVSQTIRSNLRGDDLVGRIGGEEFLLVLPSKKPEDAYAIAERIRKEIMSLKWEEDIIVTVSGGIATSEDVDVEKLLEVADTLLYRAKENGKNKIMLL